jgi:hypothetical protein
MKQRYGFFESIRGCRGKLPLSWEAGELILPLWLLLS